MAARLINSASSCEPPNGRHTNRNIGAPAGLEPATPAAVYRWCYLTAYVETADSIRLSYGAISLSIVVGIFIVDELQPTRRAFAVTLGLLAFRLVLDFLKFLLRERHHRRNQPV